MNKINFLIAAILLMIVSLSQAAEVVGKVGYMSGSLMVQRADGTIKVIGSKSEVLAGDTLVTAKDSYAQVQMNDGMKMTLRPHSNLKIEEYKFNRQEPKSDNAIFNLLKGGLRTLSGLIGKRGDPDAYKMRTATATIGIRGTDFSSRLCATPNCQDDVAASARNMDKPQAAPLSAAGGVTPPPAAPAAPPGLYVTVHNGQVVMAQAGNSLNLGRGETGFASPAALVRLPVPPAFMNADTKQTNAIEAKAAKEESKAAAKADEGKGDGKANKEKADTKPEEEKKDGKTDKEKAEAKPDSDKKDGAQEKEKVDVKPDGEKGSDQPEASKESIAPEEMNAGSPEPAINQGGCVVQ